MKVGSRYGSILVCHPLIDVFIHFERKGDSFRRPRVTGEMSKLVKTVRNLAANLTNLYKTLIKMLKSFSKLRLNLLKIIWKKKKKLRTFTKKFRMSSKVYPKESYTKLNKSTAETRQVAREWRSSLGCFHHFEAT